MVLLGLWVQTLHDATRKCSLTVNSDETTQMMHHLTEHPGEKESNPAMLQPL